MLDGHEGLFVSMLSARAPLLHAPHASVVSVGSPIARAVSSLVSSSWRYARPTQLRSVTAAVDKTVTSASTSRTSFGGSTPKELHQWLEEAGVPVEGVYGTGLAKTVDELLDEVQKSESILELDGGKALRIVNVLSVHVLNGRGQVLFEAEQQLPNGCRRHRNVPLSEKMIGAETWQQALKRAVAEELGSILPPDYTVTPYKDSYFLRTELSSSMSYPGLLTKYIFHRVRATITGLPDSEFSTVEARPTGQLRTKWTWRVVPTEVL